MSYNKLRLGRTSITRQIYLVTAVTTQRRRIFEDLYCGRLVVNALRELDYDQYTRTLAFVVMPDHVHWLFELLPNNTLAKALNLFKGRSSRRLNQLLATSGHIWQPSFHDHAVRTEESLVETARYVIMNPVRAGLVGRIDSYPLWDCIWV